MADQSPTPEIASESVSYNQFGTIGGVFTPSILTILGVIMFMRTGEVIGRSGIGGALLILIIANLITFLTGLSISAISTNTKVKGGGAYFLISRSLGPEFGGAIGLALFFAQALSVPFYILGFTEALVRSGGGGGPSFLTIGLITTGVLFTINYISSAWAIRAQYFILGVLILSIFVFMIGSTLNFEMVTFEGNWDSLYTGDDSFWTVFAVFFPAVTGILTGVNMSGDLKNPAESIPKGTLAAIFVGFTIYFIQILLMGGAQSRSDLVGASFETMLSQAFMGMEITIIAGVMAATLSSALGSFMGAPRILQALARDNIFPSLKIFAKGTAKGDEPRRAMLLTLVMTVGVLFVTGNGGGGGALNAVAVILSMFFLYTYGMTNLAAFIEQFSGNPSFRPRFRYFHWMTALLGGISCFGVAILISPVAAAVAGIIVALIFLQISRRVLSAAFGDARRGFFFDRVRSNLFKLDSQPTHPKNWRPQSLVLSGSLDHRLALTRYAIWIESGHGIVTLAQILLGKLDDRFEDRTEALKQLKGYIEENNLDAFPKVIVAPDLYQGISSLVQGHGLGPLEPNLVVMGWTQGVNASLGRHLNMIQRLGLSLVLVHDKGLPDEVAPKRIDVWWRGNKNGSLMILLSYMLTQNWGWRQAHIRLLRLVQSEDEREVAAKEMHEILDAARIKGKIKIVLGGTFKDALNDESEDATVVLMGFQPPAEESQEMAFQTSYSNLLEGLPTTLLVYSSGEVDLLA